MKSIIGCLFLLVSLSVEASSNSFSEQMAKSSCSQKIRAQIDSKLQRQTWVPVAISLQAKPLYYGITFRDTRSKKVYKIWSEEDRSVIQETDLAKMQDRFKVFDAKLCEMSVSTGVFKYPELPTKEGFTDRDLYKTLKANKWGVIYVWSPYMRLSVKGLKDIKAAVKKKGGHLTILVDGKSYPKDSKQWVEDGEVLATELTPVASNELYNRDVILHYPITYIYADGLLSNRSYAGYKPKEIFEKWIDLERAELAKDMHE